LRLDKREYKRKKIFLDTKQEKGTEPKRKTKENSYRQKLCNLPLQTMASTQSSSRGLISRALTLPLPASAQSLASVKIDWNKAVTGAAVCLKILLFLSFHMHHQIRGTKARQSFLVLAPTS
jgi:hypothetical protein